MPILSTKLHMPTSRRNMVIRPRLMKLLNDGLQRKMTLVSASAGFGKTTLVSEWTAQYKHPAAWLSLDEWDNDLTRFLTYLVAAVQTVYKEIGQDSLRALQSPQPPTSEWVLSNLLNDISIGGVFKRKGIGSIIACCRRLFKSRDL